MKRKAFKDYLVERTLREEEQAIKVDPASRAMSRPAQTAVARTLSTTDVDLSKAKTDPRVKNQFLGTALAKAQAAGARGVNLKTIAHTVDPEMKV